MGSSVAQLWLWGALVHTPGEGTHVHTHSQIWGGGALHGLWCLGLWGLESRRPIPEARQRHGSSSGAAQGHPPGQTTPGRSL